jgi:hypothetical protein
VRCTVMKIYFPKISFQSSPLVWELDEQTNQATCLFYTKNNGLLNDKVHALIFKTLKTFACIEVSEDSAVIKDVSTFGGVYIPVSETEKLTKALSTRAITPLKVPLRQKSTFFTLPPSPITSPRTTPKLEHLHLTYLIPKGDPSTSSLWGDTVAYLEHFEKKTAQEKYDRAAAYVKSSFAFKLNVQHEKSTRLIPLKKNVISRIKELLISLDEVYIQWYAEKSPLITKNFIKYFQNGVLEAMLNEPVNNRVTDFDNATQSHYSPALREYSRKQALELRTNFMLIKFLCLVTKDDKFPIEFAVNETELDELKPLLSSLREFFLKQTPEYLHIVNTKLEEIAQCIIASHATEVSNIELSDKIILALASSPVVRGFVSYNSILQKITHPNDSKPELPLSITHTIIQTTIQAINKNFKKNYSQSIAPLGTLGDKDFYLLQAWEAKLIAKLKSINQKDLKKNNTDKYATAVAEKVVTFLQKHVHENVQKESPETAVATSSSSFSL